MKQLLKRTKSWVIERMISFADDEDGQGLTEYALVLILISIALVASLTTLGPAVTDRYEVIINALAAV